MRESKKSEYGDGKFEYASTSIVVNTLAEKKKLVNSRSGLRSTLTSNIPKTDS